MSIKVPNEGELKILANIRDPYFQGFPLNAGLFQDNYTPADGDTLATYTAIEADFDGYTVQTLTTWITPILVAGKAFISTLPIIWTPTGSVTPNDIYGFFVYDFVDNKLLWAGRFAAAPIAVTGPTTPVVYTPSFTLKTEF